MRDIKFRAYIKNLEWLVPVTSIDFDLKTLEVDLTAGQGDTTEYEFKEVELMQYTGLKDCNEKEIYEGDIIEFTWEEDSCWGEPGTYKAYIRFEKGVFEIVYMGRDKIRKYPDGTWTENNTEDDIKRFLWWTEKINIEVVGNIYTRKF